MIVTCDRLPGAAPGTADPVMFTPLNWPLPPAVRLAAANRGEKLPSMLSGEAKVSEMEAGVGTPVAAIVVKVTDLKLANGSTARFGAGMSVMAKAGTTFPPTVNTT